MSSPKTCAILCCIVFSPTSDWVLLYSLCAPSVLFPLCVAAILIWVVAFIVIGFVLVCFKLILNSVVFCGLLSLISLLVVVAVVAVVDVLDLLIKFFNLSSIKDVKSGGGSVRMTSLKGSGVVISVNKY